jgi:hypothetical protein
MLSLLFAGWPSGLIHTALNNSDASVPQFKSFAPKPISWQAGRTFYVVLISTWHGPHRKHSSYIVVWICLHGNVLLTQSLHSNSYTRHTSYCDSSSIVMCGHHQATAVPVPPQFFLWANMPQYFHYHVRTNLKRWTTYASNHCWLFTQLGKLLSRETTAIVTIDSSSLWCSVVW